MLCLAPGPWGSSSLQLGHRFAKPGLLGFSSNSSEQTTHTFTGNAIHLYGTPILHWNVTPICSECAFRICNALHIGRELCGKFAFIPVRFGMRTARYNGPFAGIASIARGGLVGISD